MGTGPIPASRAALKKAGWKAADLDLVEANEAFAAQACAVNKDMGWDPAKVNVNGGAIAIGHPIGASGARILITLLYEMSRRNAKKGLATLCIGGGMGIALLRRDAEVATSHADRYLFERSKMRLNCFQMEAKEKHMARVAMVTGGTRGIGDAISRRAEGGRLQGGRQLRRQ